MVSNNEPNEDEVLLAFSVEPTHDLATLERYLRRYPQFAGGLIDCSIELEHSPDAVEISKTVTPASTAAWDRFQVAMGIEISPTMNPFARLSSEAFKAVAAELHMNVLLLMRLRDRAIKFATIPGPLVRMLAGKLGVGTDGMEKYLGSMPALDGGNLQFKSASKPSPMPQIDFAEAVRTSQLTEEQQQQLLTLGD
jgi:hypothetical protein